MDPHSSHILTVSQLEQPVLQMAMGVVDEDCRWGLHGSQSAASTQKVHVYKWHPTYLKTSSTLTAMFQDMS